MPKRKSAPEEEPPVEPVRRRSSRLQSSANVAAPSAPPTTRETRTQPSTKKPRAKKTEKDENNSESQPFNKKSPAGGKGASETATLSDNAAAPEGERNYWLMKAEPESRFENGVDVKFSIDDLRAKTEPEPWDGIRSYAARNNLRAMKKGELAFFYHSNCSEPGIYGTMEIVREHSPDLTAHDPKAPYYDPKSDPSNPKWSVVHVKFRSKFAVPILLKELREMGAPGKPLENMQLLKQSRLSVTKVSPAEWKYLMEVAEQKASKSTAPDQ
ncbi:hypothetical protein VTG60DRAFT_1669 [Thermothelomyces hinnuleus]